MSRHSIVFLLVGAAMLGALPAAGRSQTREQGSEPAAITFNKDIKPLLWQNCITCHRTDRLGAFSLVTFADVRPRAKEIVRAVKSRQMPPWKPEPGHGDFAGVRRLSNEQIALIERWVATGSREGNARDLPPLPPADGTWQLGDPDLIVAMPEPYEVVPGGRDVFRTFVVPIPLNVRRYVRAIEFHPGSFTAVHHANIKIDRTRFSRQWDQRDPGPGYSGGGSREAAFPDGHFLGWTPGQSPRISPPGMAWRLEPKSDLVIEMHIMPAAAGQNVQARVGLYFTDEAPTKSAYMLRLGRQDLDIPAGRSDYTTTDSYTLPVDVDVLAVQPHAHYLARQIRASAALPDGSIKPLIYIKDWDFHWQDVYQFAAPVPLPKGTVVSMRYTYDNSAGNRNNPHRPPRRVTFGQTTASEMGSFWLQVLPRSAADLTTLDRDFWPKLLADDIAGNEKWLEMNPGDAQIHAELGMCYYEAGRGSDALAQLVEAARLDPTAGRHYDVGRLLLLLRRFPEAVASFQTALSAEPNSPEALYGLGLAFDAQGQLDNAVTAYTKALELNLDFADAHFNLARVLTLLKNYGGALEHYHRALELNPYDAETLDAIERLRALR
jgi:tetratricopeptide (TPR) repeat protein/mono/diheme cytochrome c family protein